MIEEREESTGMPTVCFDNGLNMSLAVREGGGRGCHGHDNTGTGSRSRSV